MAKCRPVGLAVQWLQIQVQLWPLAGFGLGHPEFKSLAMHVNYSHVVASCQLAFDPVMFYLNYLFLII